MLGKGARNSGKRSGGAKSQKTISEFFVSFQDNFDTVLGQFKGQSR